MFPCRRLSLNPINRRQMLRQTACGIGAVALSALLNEEANSAGRNHLNADPFKFDQLTNPQDHFSGHPLHHTASAKSVIYLYMDGGPSQVDSFDPKPRLAKENGQVFGLKMEPTQFNNNGKTLASPWTFQQYGQSGIPVSSLFPNIAKHVDKLAVIRSMTSNFSEHTNANYFLHTGNGFQGRPSMGAWAGYGLGSESKDLPGFVVLNGGLIPPGGMDCFGSGFLPASFQGSLFSNGPMPVANIQPPEKVAGMQRKKLDLIRDLDQMYTQSMQGQTDPIETAILNYELAYRMQDKVPQLMDLANESKSTISSYGIDSGNSATQIYGRQCLIARRLVEQGVRFIEVTCPAVGTDRWDQHSGLKSGHEANSLAVDQPIGALLEDLEARGLLDETLVVWSGEFGRTPFAQGSDGRDHNPFGFSLWMAGGGVRGGTIYGATDEYGYKAVQGKLQIHDLHATMLHLLGVDHKRLTYRWGGRDMRLTDVHGKVVQEVIA